MSLHTYLRNIFVDICLAIFSHALSVTFVLFLLRSWDSSHMLLKYRDTELHPCPEVPCIYVMPSFGVVTTLIYELQE